MKEKILNAIRFLKGFFPTKLPVGVSEFEIWIDTFFATYDLPTKDKDSVKFAVSTMIMHLGPQDHRKPMYYFYKSLHAGAAKQIANQVFYDVKTKQQEAAKAAASAAPTEAASNVQSN